jgi:hypothetical protein
MKNKNMKSLCSVLLLGLMTSNVQANVTCKAYPQSEWANQDDLKQVLIELGYTIKTLKIKNNCYEMYGKSKQNIKVEIYFDMKSLSIVAAEFEK